MTYFFISYKHDDEAFVNELEDRLQKDNIDTWTDRRIKPGEEWKPVIDQRIEDSLGVIVIISQKSLASQYVTYEWSYAKGKDKQVIPILLEAPGKDDEIQIHPRLTDIQYIIFSESDSRPWEALVELLQSISSRGVFSVAIKGYMSELNSSSPATWKQEISQLEKWQEPEATEALARAVTDNNNPLVHQYAALALSRRTKNKDTRALPGLNEILEGINRDGSAWEHQTNESINILGQFHLLGAVNILASGFTNEEHQERQERIAQALGTTEVPEAAYPLIEALSNLNLRVVIAASKSLGQLGNLEAIAPLSALIEKYPQRDQCQNNAPQAASGA